eukprot:724360_1
MTIQQKLNQQQTAQTESKQDSQSNASAPAAAAEDSSDPYHDLKRMLELNTDNKVEPKLIVDFMQNQKDVPFKRIFEIIEDKENHLDLHAVFDIFTFCNDSNMDTKRMFGNNYPDLVRLFQLNHIRKNKIASHRIISFIDRNCGRIEMQNVYQCIDDNQNGTNLEEIFDLFDYGRSNAIDLNSVFGAGYPDFKRLFQYYKAKKKKSKTKKAKKVNSRNLQRIMVFMDKTKDVDLQRLWDVIDDKRYKLDLKAASDLFDPDEIDLESMFGKNYGYLTRLFTLRRGHGHNISNKRIVKFANKVKDVNFEAIFELIEDDGNEIDLKVIFEFVNANTTKDTDFKRLFEVGSEAIPAWVKINECKQSRSRTVDKENIKQKVCVNADKVQKQLNEECEWMRNQIDTMQKNITARIEFEKNLYIEHVMKYTSQKEDADAFTDTFLKCLSNTKQSIAATKKQFQQLHAKAVTSSNKRSLSTSPLSVSCNKGKLKESIEFSGSDVDVTLKPLTLKCSTVNGNIVTLDWGPTKPWEDKDNYVLSKLHALNQLETGKCAYVVQCGECEDEKKHENDTVYVDWMDINFKQDRKKAEWREQCDIFLDNNKTYKFRIQYSYSGYGTSEFSNVITIKTTKETPLTKGIGKYEAKWSDTFHSEHVALKDNNTLAFIPEKTDWFQCVRATNKITKGSKIMLEFVGKSKQWCGLAWGVVRRKTTNKSGNDMHEFTASTIDGFYGITECAPHENGTYWTIASESYWVDGFLKRGMNNIKLVINWTANRCSLLYIVNGLILYRGKKERYSIKISGITDDEHLYPCILIKCKQTACQIKSVEV